MGRGPDVTLQERERILELIREGKSANQIAKDTGRARDTVCRIAAESGHVFGKTNREKADARNAYAAEARARLKLSLLAEAERLRDRLRGEQTVYAFMGGGKDYGPEFMDETLEELEPKAVREIMTAIGIAIDKAEAIEKNDRAREMGDDGKGAMLALLAAMNVELPEGTNAGS